MRILAAADVHGRWPVYEWLLAVARTASVQAVILAGDLLGCPDGFLTPEEAQQYEASRLAQLLDAAEVPVFYIMGNDDLVELNPSGERLVSIHRRRIVLGQFALIGYQYSLPFMGGTFEKPEAGIKGDLDELVGTLDSKTVFVSHSPAFGILDPGFGDTSIGSQSLRAFLGANPFLAHIHGHSHAGFGRHGKHFNVASAGRRRCFILNLTTLEHELVEH